VLVIGERRMQPANFRAEFRETLQELTDLAGDAPTTDSVLWTVEYLTRGPIWYHFNGYCRNGMQVSSGRAFHTSDGSVANDEGIMMTFRLLDFQYNRFIGAYAGDRRLSTQIASELLKGFERVPEIVTVTIDRERGASVSGSSTPTTTTNFVYVGFERLEDVDDVGSGQLAASRSFLSPYWCRGRISIVGPVNEFWRPKPLNADGAI
jgi:hypothetical protein